MKKSAFESKGAFFVRRGEKKPLLAESRKFQKSCGGLVKCALADKQEFT